MQGRTEPRKTLENESLESNTLRSQAILKKYPVSHHRAGNSLDKKYQ